MSKTIIPALVNQKFSLPWSSFQNILARVKIVKLICAIVGVEGNAFPVDIDADQLVGDLKKARMAKKPKGIDADKLKLFLAKTEGGAWLDEAGVAFVALDEHQIHVLVVVPVRAVEYGTWMPIDLSTLDPQVQLKMWKSVVRVFSEVECSGTAVVVDETSTHLYLLTNLYMWERSQSVSEMPPPNENMLWTLMLQSNHVFTDGSDAIVVYFG
ncbi:hypothetical protein Plhal304r1_c040g0117601 [Plasmopara halstedii]